MMMASGALILAGRYRLESRIAAGGAGEVWRASDRVLGRAVAVKVLRAEYADHPEALARFRAEARHAGAVSHPGIAQVYDYGEDGQPFLVMELVNGPSLAGVLAAGPLDVVRAMDVVAQTAAALQAAHSAGLVHRDVKPANLLIGPDWRVKITDFGIAHAAGAAPFTRTGTLIGTPAYLAPERVAGQPAIPASDLYSLGIVCYECLAGQPPFTGAAAEVALAHQHGGLPPLGDRAPAAVADLVASLTAKDPGGRPANAAETARRAAELRDALSTPSDGRSGPPRSPHAGVPAPAGRLPGQLGEPSSTLVDLPAAADGLSRPLTESASTLAAPSAATRWRAAKTAPALAVTAAAAAAGLAGWLVASGLGASAPQRQHTGPSAPGPSASPARMVEVSQVALAGEPVGAARARLRRLGLRVRVVWQVNGHEPPGTVLSIRPEGFVAAGSIVSLTATTAPAGHGKGKGNGKDKRAHGKG